MQKLLERLGIKLPIIQAPMAGVQNGALALAVCNAGGLGSLPCAMDGTREQFLGRAWFLVNDCRCFQKLVPGRPLVATGALHHEHGHHSIGRVH